MRLPSAMLDEGGRAEDRRDRSSMPWRPGGELLEAPRRRRGSRRACCAQGNFSTMRRRPRPSLMTASPIIGWWSLTTFGHVGRSGPALPSRPVTVDRARGRPTSMIGRTWLDVEPLVGRIDDIRRCPMKLPVVELEDARRRAPPTTASMTSFERNAVLGAAWTGSTWTCEHLEPLAPDRDVGDAGHAQEPRSDRPVRDHRHVDERYRLPTTCPILRNRLVADSGWIMNGGAAQVGRVGVIVRDPFGHELAGLAAGRCRA